VNRVFVDTSGILAFLIPSDVAHARAVAAFERLQASEATLVTSSYVLVETYALLVRWHGLGAVERFRRDFAPLLEVVWVQQDQHEAGLDWLAQRRLTTLSLVDAVSFVILRTQRMSDVFCYDRHFDREGFHRVS
jgi:predicted nucleic acid-binding protein